MRLEIQCEDRIGMIRGILDFFIPYQIDIRLIETDSKRRCLYCGFPDIPFADLQSLLADIRRLDGVEDVKTVMFTPSEREYNALNTLLEALPDGVVAVDLKGYITMATELAAADLGVPIGALVGKPLQQFIKGVNFSRMAWEDMAEGISKRIRLQNKSVLLEMKPIFVPDGEGHANPAGAVIHLKSQERLNRQTEHFKQAPDIEKHLETYFQKDVIQSAAMCDMLQKAKAFSIMSEPLLLYGDVGTGKKELLRALYQYWLEQQAVGGTLMLRHAREISAEDIAKLDHASGWFAIEELEYLAPELQVDLANWLLRQPEHSTSDQGKVRLIGLTSLPRTKQIGEQIHSTLYFALSCLQLRVPSLKERTDDLKGLVQQTLQRLCERYGMPMPSLTKAALVKMSLYSWPGNIKELENVCLQSLGLGKSQWDADDLVLTDDRNEEIALELVDGSLDKTLKSWEAQLLRQLYPQFPSTRRLANAVGLSHSAIANKLKEYNIGS